ncbi:MAG: hypothetical protein WC364_12350 [Eubacteriales bacterium]|jgi:hypothetical protein
MEPQDVQGIPNVQGLEALVSDEGQSQPQENQQQAAQGENKTNQPQNVNVVPVLPDGETIDDPELQGVLKVFLDPQGKVKTKDVLKSYKGILSHTTKTSQENKVLKEQMAQIQEQMDLIRLSQVRQPAQQQPQMKDFDQQFLENPQKAIESLAEQKAQSLMSQSKIQDVLEEENLKTPQEFNERYGYAKLVAQQYPQLATSTAGVRKLFQLGDKLREEQQRVNAFKAVKAIFGEDVDFDKFKQLIKKDSIAGANNNNNAYMPDTSNASGNQSDSSVVKNVDAEINEAVSKGDPDAVIKALFRQRGLR